MRDAQDTDVLERELAVTRSHPLKLALPVALGVVLVDQLTKRWALSALEPVACSEPDACIDLFAGIRFHLVFNTGAAFTRGSGYGPVLAVLAIVMSGFLFYLASRREDRLGVALFGAIAGGAIGNLIDRIFRAEDGALSGAVVDFIDLGWWPVFNIADSAIVVGVIVIIVMAFFEEQHEPELAVEGAPPKNESSSEDAAGHDAADEDPDSEDPDSKPSDAAADDEPG